MGLKLQYMGETRFNTSIAGSVEATVLVR